MISSVSDQQLVGIRTDSRMDFGAVDLPLLKLSKIAPPSAKIVRVATKQATSKLCEPKAAVRPLNQIRPAASLSSPSFQTTWSSFTVSPACNSPTVFIRVLPDSGASIDAIPATMIWNHFKHVPLVDGGPHAVTATGSAISSMGTSQLH